MMVVVDPTLEASRRAGGLNAPDQTLRDQNSKRVVHRLERDGPDLGPDDLRHAVGRDVGLRRHCPKDGQALGGDLNPETPKDIGRILGHGR
jgi:hypothetical protein